MVSSLYSSIISLLKACISEGLNVDIWVWDISRVGSDEIVLLRLCAVLYEHCDLWTGVWSGKAHTGT